MRHGKHAAQSCPSAARRAIRCLRSNIARNLVAPGLSRTNSDSIPSREDRRRRRGWSRRILRGAARGCGRGRHVRRPRRAPRSAADEGTDRRQPARRSSSRSRQRDRGSGVVGPVDVVLFTVKLYDTGAASERLAPLIGPDTVVVTLQNGVESVGMLTAAVGRFARRRRRRARAWPSSPSPASFATRRST